MLWSLHDSKIWFAVCILSVTLAVSVLSLHKASLFKIYRASSDADFVDLQVLNLSFDSRLHESFLSDLDKSSSNFIWGQTWIFFSLPCFPLCLPPLSLPPLSSWKWAEAPFLLRAEASDLSYRCLPEFLSPSSISLFNRWEWQSAGAVAACVTAPAGDGVWCTRTGERSFSSCATPERSCGGNPHRIWPLYPYISFPYLLHRGATEWGSRRAVRLGLVKHPGED